MTLGKFPEYIHKFFTGSPRPSREQLERILSNADLWHYIELEDVKAIPEAAEIMISVLEKNFNKGHGILRELDPSGYCDRTEKLYDAAPEWRDKQDYAQKSSDCPWKQEKCLDLKTAYNESANSDDKKIILNLSRKCPWITKSPEGEVIPFVPPDADLFSLMTSTYPYTSNPPYVPPIIAPSDSRYGLRSVPPDEFAVTSVSGLLGFTVHYSPEYNKRIYILGEKHTQADQCTAEYPSITAPDFFFRMLDSTDKLIDVFGEFNYIPFEADVPTRFSRLSSGILESYMVQVGDKLTRDHCFSYFGPTGCEVYKKHVRFHAADIREFSKSKFMGYAWLIYSVQRYMREIYYKAPNPDYILLLSSYIEQLSKYKDYAATSESIKEGIKQTFGEIKVNKQLENIPDKYPDVKALLNKKIGVIVNQDYSDITYDRVMSSLTFTKTNCIKREPGYPANNCVNAWYVFDPTVETFNKSSNAELARLVNISIDIMDIYLLSRIFRKFRDVPELEISELGYKSKPLIGEPRNVIIYVGNAHGDNYRRSLDELGFIREFEARARPGAEACLDITGLKLKWI